jgi:hypothetical protein
MMKHISDERSQKKAGSDLDLTLPLPASGLGLIQGFCEFAWAFT